MAEAAQDGEATEEGRGALVRFIEGRPFRTLVTTLIVLNAITLGIETARTLPAWLDRAIGMFDHFVVSFFVFEIVLKLFAYRLRFFRDGWRVFDLIVVTISVFPDAGPFSVLRALRVMRVFHIMSVMPQLRRVVEALFRALPGMGGIIAVLGLIFYVSAVMATKLFQNSVETDKFQDLGATMLTLFQVMTLEGWSEEVMRPLLVEYPWAWVFFLLFIVFTSFMVLNLFIAVIVEALQDDAFRADEARDELAHRERERQHAEVMETLAGLQAQVRALEQRAPGDDRP